MVEVILLAVALSMDVFAVSIGIGVNESGKYLHAPNRRKRVFSACVVAFYFAAFHTIFPLLGYVGGVTLFAWFENLSQWIGFSILLCLGLKAIYDSFRHEQSELVPSLTHIALFILAIATSIDAFATGFTLVLIPVSPLLSCLIIGLTTFFVSLFGLYLGKASGDKLRPKTELLAGIILIAIAFKILLF